MFRLVAVGDGHEIVVRNHTEVDCAGCCQKVRHDYEMALVLARLISNRRILLLVGRRSFNRDALDSCHNGSRVQVGKNAPDHLSGRAAKPFAFRLIYSGVSG